MLATIVVAAAIAVWHYIRVIQQPFQMDYGEGVILNAGERIVQGLKPYPDPNAYPSVLNPYGPIGYYLVAACVRLGGVSFSYPRLLVLAFGLLAVLFLVLLIEHWTASWAVAGAFGLFFLTIRAMLLWFPLLRVDLLAIALSLGGLLVWVRMPRRIWPLAVVLFAAALFVKLTALPAPAACLLSLVAEREWKRAVRFAALLAGLCLAGLAGMQGWTGGHFFFHQFRTHPDAYTLDNLLHQFSRVIPDLVTLSPFVVAFFFVKGKAARPALFYLLCSFGLVLVTGGKAGSSVNHLLEPLAACCIAGALGYQSLSRLAPRPRASAVLACALAAVALYQVVLSGRVPHPDDYTYGGCPALYRSVSLSPVQSILSENVGALVLAGKPVQVAEPFLLAQLVEHGLHPPEELERGIEAREFGLIVLDAAPRVMRLNGSERWWPAQVDQLERNYQVAGTFDCKDGNVLLKPRPLEQGNDLPNGETPSIVSGTP